MPDSLIHTNLGSSRFWSSSNLTLLGPSLPTSRMMARRPGVSITCPVSNVVAVLRNRSHENHDSMLCPFGTTSSIACESRRRPSACPVVASTRHLPGMLPASANGRKNELGPPRSTTSSWFGGSVMRSRTSATLSTKSTEVRR